MKRNLIFNILFSCLVLLIFAQPRYAYGQVYYPEESTGEMAWLTPTPTLMAEKLTELSSPEGKSRLELVLEEQQLGPLSITNFIKYGIRWAISIGIPASTIVLLLLLPLLGAFVSSLHYLVGITGLGIFAPAMLSVALLATGIFGGLTLFGVILLMALLSERILKRAKLHYWPKMAIMLSFISLGTLIFLIFSYPLNIFDLGSVSIFPILIMILLVEEFIRIQSGKSKSEALRVISVTLLLATFGTLFMQWHVLEESVLLNPELLVILTLGFNILIGRYSGFRLLEYKRFKPALRK